MSDIVEAHRRIRELAKEVWHKDGEIEIDDDAVVSASDEGAYVQAWVWVDYAGLHEDK